MEGSGHSPGEGAQREGAAGSHPGCRLGGCRRRSITRGVPIGKRCTCRGAEVKPTRAAHFADFTRVVKTVGYPSAGGSKRE